MSERTASPTVVDWPALVHRAFRSAGVSQIAYVPDAGLRRLIEICEADPDMRVVPLTSEEEGIGLAAGAWLGGAKAVVLMQSSGVGNVVNALAMARECGFPLVMLVTMRGEDGETNPWQVPMGRAADPVLAAMGVEVRRAEAAEDVAGRVKDALEHAWAGRSGARAVAVLIAQKVIGAKRFEEAKP